MSEIFFSIQGEGPSAGQPSAFLRLGFCNLTCRWCDSAFTWKDPVHAVWQSPRDLADSLSRLPVRRLVITGGEPLLWQSRLISLLSDLCFDEVEVETNATLAPIPELDSQVTAYNVSPKLRNSGVPESKRIVPQVLRWFASSPKSRFKFVLTSAGELDEVRALASRYKLPSRRIYIMPEAADRPALLLRAPGLRRAAAEAGFLFTDRAHLRLWGNARAV